VHALSVSRLNHDVERTQAPGEGDVLGRRHPEAAEEEEAETGPRILDRGDRLLIEVSSEVDTDDLGAEARVERPELDLHLVLSRDLDQPPSPRGIGRARDASGGRIDGDLTDVPIHLRGSWRRPATAGG
jgi:hypothetical protein